MPPYKHKNEASLYIHIPFCKKACIYCNFSFSTLLKYKTKVVESVQKELILRSNILSAKKIKTIYFGGGTPSLLDNSEIELILNTIFKNYAINDNAEITFEANPENLSLDKLKFIKKSNINRLSIGIQSFFDEDLLFMNRSHSSKEAINSIYNAKNIGLNNISIDLIYGYSLLSSKKLKTNIATALNLDVSHVSAYALTVEPKTALWHYINKKNLNAYSESTFNEHFDILTEYLSNKFIHYEISNWAKHDDYISKHNCSYWNLNDYIGIGPSAHSFYQNTRSWNTSNNHSYINFLSNNNLPTEGMEVLTTDDNHNEYLMLALRTKWGVNYFEFEEKFGSKKLQDLQKKSKSFISQDLLYEQNYGLKLSNKGISVSNKIISSLFI